MVQYLVFFGAAVNFAGSLAYIKKTFSGEVKPNRVTYFLWTISPFIATAAALADGVRWAVLPVFIAGFCPLLVLIVSFKNPNAYWRLRGFDYVCGLFSILALVFWWLTDNPSVAIAFSIISEIFAASPTLVKSWRYPETEWALAYVLSAFSAGTSFFVIKLYSFSEIAFPAYLVFINMLITIVIVRKKYLFFRKIGFGTWL